FSFINKGLFTNSEIPYLSPKEVRNRIAPYLLRRRKKDALPELKNMFVDTKILELTEAQQNSYDLAENEGIKRLKSNESVTLQNVLALIQALKQICNFDLHTGESTKIDFIYDYLEEACSDKDKAIIVSQYVDTLKEINGRTGEYNPLLYTGSLSPNQRTEIERQFSDNEDNKLLLLSLKAGGVGLNLTRANYLLHFDQWWNPAVEEQASARVHRIGQMKDVFITRLICSGTIEERIDRLLEQKRILFSQVIDELADEKIERVLSEEELFGLFGLKPPPRGKSVTKEPSISIDAQKLSDSKNGIPASSVIKPEEPYSNIVKMRQILRISEEYIYWADKHFATRALEEIIIISDPSLIREIKILSGPDNVNRRAQNEFHRFKEELNSKGINAEWRILVKFSHDRYLLSKNYCFNVPPVNSWFRNQYSEVLETKNRPPFEEWWEEGKPIENITVTN
ncbi:DEAD/DEAH box helicase, partial [Chloroflexota bacterium]